MTTTPNMCNRCGLHLPEYRLHDLLGGARICDRCLWPPTGNPDLAPGSGGSILHGPIPLCECGGWHRLEECGAYKTGGAA